MIRSALQSDLPQLLEMAIKSGLFEGPQLSELGIFLGDCFNFPDGKRLWVVSAGSGIVGVAYCERERMTIGTWNLLWITIALDNQRQGHGTALLELVERELAESGGYQLLIETSANRPDSLAFYRNSGYQEEGRIRDFYELGADKVVFRKVLAKALESTSTTT